MPVEIRELIIKASIQSDGADTDTNNNVVDNEEIIKKCVEQVLTILQKKNER